MKKYKVSVTIAVDFIIHAGSPQTAIDVYESTTCEELFSDAFEYRFIYEEIEGVEEI